MEERSAGRGGRGGGGWGAAQASIESATGSQFRTEDIEHRTAPEGKHRAAPRSHR